MCGGPQAQTGGLNTYQPRFSNPTAPSMLPQTGGLNTFQPRQMGPSMLPPRFQQPPTFNSAVMPPQGPVGSAVMPESSPGGPGSIPGGPLLPPEDSFPPRRPFLPPPDVFPPRPRTPYLPPEDNFPARPGPPVMDSPVMPPGYQEPQIRQMGPSVMPPTINPTADPRYAAINAARMKYGLQPYMPTGPGFNGVK